ncbi:MAG: VOC family protein, partial [Anaerolineales bacterium]|nr:VOC family protein [Anaerolineales bacterium]
IVAELAGRSVERAAAGGRMIIGFDHFIVLVNDLDAAIRAYRNLGFDARAGGEHPAFGSHNALVALADGTYIELVAFKDAALAAKTFWGAGVTKLRAGEGFGGFVLASNDLADDVAQLKSRALNIGDLSAGSRVRPDGQRVAWRIALCDNSPVGVLPFLIQDETPRTLRIEPAKEGLGSRARVKEVIVAVKETNAARDAYRALLGVELTRVKNVAGDVQGYRVALAWGNIVLAQPTRRGSALADQLARRGEGLYALTLEVQGVGRDRRELRNRGVETLNDAGGFLIAPEFACGARIRLV